MKWKWRAVGFVVAIGVFAVGLAVYRADHKPPTRHVGGPVLIANEPIPKGTPGSLVAKNGMYAPTTLPDKEVEDGAIADPSALMFGRAVVDIVPGQQLTVTDFR